MESRLEVSVDRDVNALYLRVENGTVARTIEFSPTVTFDVDENGRMLGVEFIDADEFIPFVREHDGVFQVDTSWLEAHRVAV